jgi:hypothetical protein
MRKSRWSGFEIPGRKLCTKMNPCFGIRILRKHNDSRGLSMNIFGSWQEMLKMCVLEDAYLICQYTSIEHCDVCTNEWQYNHIYMCPGCNDVLTTVAATVAPVVSYTSQEEKYVWLVRCLGNDVARRIVENILALTPQVYRRYRQYAPLNRII